MKQQGKLIVLTGVSRGLGRAMAEQLISRGHTVVGCARSDKDIGQLQKRFPFPHDFVVLDVTQDRAIKAWASRILKTYGPPDFLINNAAVINRNAPLWEIEAEEFSSVIDINIKGPANVIRHFVPAMVKRGWGVIVNFSSGWGRSTDADVAPYCATKFAIEGLTQALAQELPKGLAAIPLNPGIIDTAMLRSSFGSSAASYPSADEWALRAVPYILALGPEHNGQSLTVE